MNHNRSEYAVVTYAVVMLIVIRCSDSRCNDIVSLLYAVVKDQRCIVEEVEDPKKWLTNLPHYAIIVPHLIHG